MSDRPPPPRPAPFLAPEALFAGIAFSFLACCLAGLVVGEFNVFRDFRRFHRFINGESLFYPTARQVRALARSRAVPGKTLVIVGGNSILFGTGQRPEHLWTRRLQELLGDEFVVLNLALPGGLPSEFGSAAAEALAREHPRVLFVTDFSSAGAPLLPDGLTYRYFFWDARARGLLTSDAAREERIRELAPRRGDGEAFDELRRQMLVDRVVSSRDLWTALAYRGVATVWSPFVGPSFTKPRRKYSDLDPGPNLPFETRYTPALHEWSMYVLRGWTAGTEALVAGKDADGTPALEKNLLPCFPPDTRERTLLLAVWDSPYYYAQLDSAEQQRYAATFGALVPALERLGFAALEVGEDYTVDDFYDRCHLSEQGGRRLAEEVAPKLCEMARRLGYTAGPSPP